jgi:hypothetical protein
MEEKDIAALNDVKTERTPLGQAFDSGIVIPEKDDKVSYVNDSCVVVNTSVPTRGGIESFKVYVKQATK